MSTEQNEGGMTLFELMSNVQSTLQRHMGSTYWVRAELLHANTNRHCYLELTDYGKSNAQVAKSRAVIWASNLGIVKAFEAKTGMKLASGMKLLLQVQVSFHPQYGLSLVIKNIDPTFTLGDMEAQLEEIRSKLKAAGIYDKNRTLKLPRDFTRVAVIAPNNAAGLGDFRTQADRLAAFEVCAFDYYEASFQGINLLSSMKACFERIHEKADQYDCIVMIRGGGDKAGLYELNRLELAELVCRSDIPVIAGIGHERDVTLIDELVAGRCSTPSLVVSHIAGTIVDNVKHAQINMGIMRQHAQEQIATARQRTDSLISTIRLNTHRNLSQCRTDIDKHMESIRFGFKQTLSGSRHNIEVLIKQVLNRNPEQILQQGYAIVRGEAGQVITSKENADHVNSITLQFHDGKSKKFHS